MKKGDLQLLSEIYVDVYTKFDVGERWTVNTAKKMLTYFFKQQPDLSFVAEYRGKIVGAFIAIVKPWCDGNHLTDGEVFVHPDYQRFGIGKELSKVIYKTAITNHDIKAISFVTFRKFEFPLKWYKSHGFKENEDSIMITGDAKDILRKLEKK